MKEVYIDDVRSSEGMGLLVRRLRRTGRLRIAILASESSKDIVAKFVNDRLSFFRQHEILATTGTSTVLRSHSELTVESVGHGPDGGDVVIAYKILRREIDVLVFLRTGTEVDSHTDDVRMLLRVANMTNCVVATNVATATLVVRALEGILPASPGNENVTV